MGWADCGTDSKGRNIGYAYEATCDHEGCSERIDRGLSYVCGDMHGEDEVSCEKYFCEEHRNGFIEYDNKTLRVCCECEKALLDTGEWKETEDGELVLIGSYGK